MSRSTIALILGLFLCSVFSLTAQAQSTIAEQEAQSIAVDAYIYFYPLVTMDVTRKQLTNVEPGKGIGSPMNVMYNVPTFPTADMKLVVRPNFDTLYSIVYLDLTKEPIVVSVPDTGGRYYLLPILDMWTDVFASPGWRTTGTQAANFCQRHCKKPSARRSKNTSMMPARSLRTGGLFVKDQAWVGLSAGGPELAWCERRLL
jgi:hypothetical protein